MLTSGPLEEAGGPPGQGEQRVQRPERTWCVQGGKTSPYLEGPGAPLGNGVSLPRGGAAGKGRRRGGVCSGVDFQKIASTVERILSKANFF